mgnify:CR=1 FL=1
MAKEGKFIDEVYYSSQMPKGKIDDWPYEYDPDLYKTMHTAHKADNDSLKVIQKELSSMGLLEKEQVDGYMGEKTQGAIKRYLLNTQPSMWQALKESDLNIFK